MGVVPAKPVVAAQARVRAQLLTFLLLLVAMRCLALMWQRFR